jgi:hypothetical protein
MVISPGGLGGDPGSADGGDKGAIADVAGEENLVDAGAQLPGAQDITPANQAGIALDHRPKFADATLLDPVPWVRHPRLWGWHVRRDSRLGGGVIRGVQGVVDFSFCFGCHCTHPFIAKGWCVAPALEC